MWAAGSDPETLCLLGNIQQFTAPECQSLVSPHRQGTQQLTSVGRIVPYKGWNVPSQYTWLHPSLCLKESFSRCAGMREGLKAPCRCGVDEQHGMAVVWRGLGDTEVRMNATDATVVQDCCGTGLAGGCAGPGELTLLLLQTRILPSNVLCFCSHHQQPLVMNKSRLHST